MVGLKRLATDLTDCSTILSKYRGPAHAMFERLEERAAQSFTFGWLLSSAWLGI